MEYMYKATKLIVKTFEERDMKFRVNLHDNGHEVVEAGFTIDNGPFAVVNFISTDNENDVSVRLFGLINSVRSDKKARIIEACNELNRAFRFVKFLLDKDMDVNVEYDFPNHTPDDGVGEMCAEIFRRTALMLDDAYAFLMKALYTDQELVFEDKTLRKRKLIAMLHRLLAEHDQPITGDETPEELIRRIRELHLSSGEESGSDED